MNPLIVHVETSSRACSVAVSRGSEILFHQTRNEQYVHSAALVPMIGEGLKACDASPRDMDAVSVSIGPGSYTGLRVGLSTAKGICYAAGCPLIAVDTLQSLAWQAMELHTADVYVAALDARRMDAYLSVFDANRSYLAGPQFMTVTAESLDQWWQRGSRLVICGEGTEKWEMFSDLPEVAIIPVSSDARHLVPLAAEAFEDGRFADLRTCVPVYVKAPNITIPA